MRTKSEIGTLEVTSVGTQFPAEVLEIARATAEAVDAEGRFPSETFEALKAHGLLSFLVPGVYGGAGGSLADAALHCQALGAACASSAMILAMHHIQVASLVRHSAANGWHADFLRHLQRDQLLLASVTSEEGVGGSIRTSSCALERDGDEFSVTKRGTAVSYGAAADALLLTARAHPAAQKVDQVMVVIDRSGLALERTSVWDAMGMRGTGTEAFVVTGRGSISQIVPAPFAEIAAATMTPVSHILWSAVWTGIAGDAVNRAWNFLRARRKPGETELPQGALILAEAVEVLQMAEARLRTAIAGFEWDSNAAPNFAGAAFDNGLKTSVSEACLHVAREAMTVCGFVGYARSGEFSVARHVRDLTSAPLMIANSRMRDGAARLLMAQRPQIGLGSV
ncbi:MAG: acyl-CoA dehydrogenase [Alphaproteobacteria bacterium PA2]|nr:MAG: acyl-CoA dehydrogenase [Alphaproteobacteria bacterium PA2]